MSDEELKSAWELAQEKLNAQEEMAAEKLTAEQKKAIAEARSKYRARIAELEIHKESKIKQAALAGAYEEAELQRKQLLEERSRLNREMEKEVEKLRKSGGRD